MLTKLTSFGNFLLKQIGAKTLAPDGVTEIDRVVTDADLSNWKEDLNLLDYAYEAVAEHSTRYSIDVEKIPEVEGLTMSQAIKAWRVVEKSGAVIKIGGIDPYDHKGNVMSPSTLPDDHNPHNPV